MKFNITRDNVKISGRTLFRDSICFLGYSASSVSFRFNGMKASAGIISNPDSFPAEYHAWIAVYIDNALVPDKRIELKETEQEIVLYDSPVKREVQITIMKYTEPEFAVCGISYIQTDSVELLAPPAPKKRRMQIIGDSITCGYGVEGDVERLEIKTSEENPAKAYSVIAANELDADFEIVAWNGKGIITSYVGEEEYAVPDKTWLLPMLYKYTDAGCCKNYFNEPQEKWELWEHSSFEPDIITINLGTNDASYTRGIPGRTDEFTNGYLDFLEDIHAIHPDAAILCMLGIMDQLLCPAASKAAELFKKKYPEVNISYLNLPLQQEEDGLGTFWHPVYKSHQKAARLITGHIRHMMDWGE